MKTPVLVLFLVFHSLAFAQNALSGKIQDESGTPLSYVNIGLVKLTDSSLVASAVSNAEGRFSIPSPAPGSYYLRLTFIGFTEMKTGIFDLSPSSLTKDFGTLTLKPEMKNMEEVNVTAVRPTITQLQDRMVVNVQGTIMAAGNNAFNVLSKAPGVFVDAEGNIQLNGRGGVLVMIDGRRTYLSATDLRNLLESTAAENIKNLELITNPSSKYDAEGTAGIININFKKPIQQGISGSLYGGYTYNFYDQVGITAGGNINFKTGNWNMFASLDFSKRVFGRNSTFTRVFNSPGSSTYFDQSAIGNGTVIGPPIFRTGADYNLNDRHSVGYLFNFTSNNMEAEFLTDTYIGNEPKTYSLYVDADNYNKNKYQSFTGNIHYTGKLDTNGTTLSTDLDYVRITNRGEAHLYNYFTNLATGEKTSSFLYNNTPNGFDVFSAKVDLTLPLNRNQKVEAGAKTSKVMSDNDYRFYFNNGMLELDPQRTNHFKYDETIYAAYLNYAGNLSKKLSFQTGLRTEATKSIGNSLTTGKVNQREYLDFFPSLFLTQKLSEQYTINLNYSRRITRPNYGNLNPFRAYRDPYTWYEGNTGLRPQYTHFFSMVQTFKKQYNLTLSHQLNKDVMAEIPILLVDDTTTVYTTGNVNDGKSTSLTLVGPVKISKKWDTQNTILLNYSKFSMNSVNGYLENEGLFFMFQSNHTILLPKEFKMELNLLFRGPAVSGLYQLAAMHRVDLAFRKTFYKKKFDLSVNANDIFKGFRYMWTTDINGHVNEFDQYFRFRTVGLTLRYNFSKGQKVNLKQRNGVEELNRM